MARGYIPDSGVFGGGRKLAALPPVRKETRSRWAQEAKDKREVAEARDQARRYAKMAEKVAKERAGRAEAQAAELAKLRPEERWHAPKSSAVSGAELAERSEKLSASLEKEKRRAAVASETGPRGGQYYISESGKKVYKSGNEGGPGNDGGMTFAGGTFAIEKQSLPGHPEGWPRNDDSVRINGIVDPSTPEKPYSTDAMFGMDARGPVTRRDE